MRSTNLWGSKSTLVRVEKAALTVKRLTSRLSIPACRARQRHLGQPLECIDQQVLQARHFGVLAANPLDGAGLALCRLLTLVTEHDVSSHPIYWDK